MTGIALVVYKFKEVIVMTMQYIGTKMVVAWPQEKDGEDGYAVKYDNGYISWSPVNVFESAYLPLVVNQDLKTDMPSISAEMVDGFIKETEVITMGKKTTVVMAVLQNGFVITESSSCVIPENYDESIGVDICMERIKNKVWEYLGFLLQTAVYGIK
jgi:hypothetical protein